MQVNLNPQNNNLNFGWMRTDKAADSVLWWRTTKPERYQMVRDIIDSMKNSSNNANIYRKTYSKRLVAIINEHNGHGIKMTESWWDRFTHSPAKFLADVRDRMIEMEKKKG